MYAASPVLPPGQLMPAVSAAIARRAAVLAPNQRIARALRRSFDRDQIASGASSWTPPTILPLDAWLSTLWHQLLLRGGESRLLLNAAQEHSLWRDLIAADREVSGLGSADALASIAASAWRLLCLHHGRGRIGDFNVSTDARAFARWARDLQRACQRNGWLPEAQLPEAIVQPLARGQVEVPAGGIVLVEFDSLLPAHARLFDSLSQAGYPVERVRTEAEVESARLVTAPDSQHEMRAAARWAARLLAQSPTTRIAIVVPDLADRRPQLERVFAEIAGAATSEFSLGRPLAEIAPVAAALDLLRWTLRPLPLESISALLLSPFAGGMDPEEALPAAEFDAFELREARLLRPELTLQAATQLLARGRRSQKLGTLLRNLRTLRKAAETEQMLPLAPGQEGPRQSHAGWADAFANLLDAAGWDAATASSDSFVFQARAAWQSLLDSLATLDFDGVPVTAAQAHETLQRLGHETIFAPESRNLPIQIMGPLEAGGEAVDALWFLGADDRNWPPAPATNPMIPWQLQRELGIEAADPERVYASAQRLTERLAGAARQVVFSYAARDPDITRRPSPLLRPLGLRTLAVSPEPVHKPEPLQVIADSEPLAPLPSSPTPGGARVLELQAACPFRAFAEIRLHSSAPESRSLGLDPRDRGVQVHRILQDFWTRLHSQEALRELTQPQREAWLFTCIDAEIARSPHPEDTWDAAYLEIQRERLRQLLLPWLTIELNRPPFRVLQQEEKRLIQLGPLTLELRADRLDETSDGLLILDYKTGDARSTQWLGERPDAPQLPLYAVLTWMASAQAAAPAGEATQSVGGVAFALLRAGDALALRGFADSAGVFGKASASAYPSLPEQIAQWQETLTRLAEAFATGDPVVHPKLYPITCERCGQRTLCRLNPASLENEGLESPASEGLEESDFE